jgi:hypothetical protein
MLRLSAQAFEEIGDLEIFPTCYDAGFEVELEFDNTEERNIDTVCLGTVSLSDTLFLTLFISSMHGKCARPRASDHSSSVRHHDIELTQRSNSGAIRLLQH